MSHVPTYRANDLRHHPVNKAKVSGLIVVDVPAERGPLANSYLTAGLLLDMRQQFLQLRGLGPAKNLARGAVREQHRFRRKAGH